MSSEGKKILLPVDGSAQSLETVKYVSQILPASNTKVVLFHVLSKIPEHFRDLGIIPVEMSGELAGALEVLERQQKSRMQDFTDQACDVLVKAGFLKKNLVVKIQEIKEGFARDIAAEALDGYDAMAIGRKGMNPLQEMVLGSIAAKLTTNYCRIPVWLVGGNPRNGKVLIAVDPSDSAIEAVDHVSAIFNGGTEEIRLIHAVRGVKFVSDGYQNIFVGDYIEKLNEDAANKIKPVFEEAADHLEAGGIASDRITSTVVTGVASRAGAILSEAEQGDFGTIVMGRRGVTKLTNYDMGRVTYKMVQMVTNRAVWVVGC